MTSSENGADTALSGMVKDAEEYYSQLQKRHSSETRLHMFVVGVVVWFAGFAVLGFGALATEKGPTFYNYLVGAFLFAILLGVGAAVVTYNNRRKRGFKFNRLGDLLQEMRGRQVTAEDGLRLMDAMHEAAVTSRKRRLDVSFEYGVAAFILVAVVGLNAAAGALAGVIVYLYFRFEALREYESEDRKYEDSKKELLLNL